MSPQTKNVNWVGLREQMVEDQLLARGISDPRVVQAMRHVKRHKFVPLDLLSEAYKDLALPIGLGQTISQPYIVAYVAELLEIDSTDTVLEVGAGSGYQAAVLAEIAKQVYTIEIIEPLYKQASHLLKNRDNVFTKFGDGYQGWQEHSPFDAILITAAAPRIPTPLVEQLKIGGRLVLPLDKGPFSQDLLVLTKKEDGSLEKKYITAVVFVPMTGEVRR
jgi:protein-L-isoaspartate(D-aspartate) O-methyltransferase